MSSRVTQGIISILLVLIISAGGTCVALSKGLGEKPCPKNKAMHSHGSPLHHAPCKVFPCRPDKGPVPTGADLLGSRTEGKYRGKVDIPPVSGISKTEQFSLGLFQSTGHLLYLSSSGGPPYFILHCAFLC